MKNVINVNKLLNYSMKKIMNKNHILSVYGKENIMIKYVDISGYTNLGEVQMFSHLYQFMEKDKEIPMTILVHAYECGTKIFKGYVFNKTATYKSVPLTEEELSKIEWATGKVEQLDFKDFIVGTIAEDCYKDFKST